MSEDRPGGPLVSLGRGLIRLRAAALVIVALVTSFFAYHAVQLRLMSRFDELLPATHRNCIV